MMKKQLFVYSQAKRRQAQKSISMGNVGYLGPTVSSRLKEVDPADLLPIHVRSRSPSQHQSRSHSRNQSPRRSRSLTPHSPYGRSRSFSPDDLRRSRSWSPRSPRKSARSLSARSPRDSARSLSARSRSPGRNPFDPTARDIARCVNSNTVNSNT